MLYKFLALLLLASVAVAVDLDAGPSAGYNPGTSGQSNATITLTSVNDYILSGVSYVRCLDYADTTDELFVSDYGTDLIYNLNPSTGALNYSIAAPPEVPQVTGVVYQWNAGDELFINDWASGTDVWKYSGAVWSNAFPNIWDEPRGMDMDDTGYIWGQDAADRVLYRCDQTGGDVTSWAMPECPASYSCGIAVFPFGPNLGIVIGGYSWTDFYFYEYDGANLTFLGSAPIFQSVSGSYGLTYSNNTDSFFWIYRDVSIYHITEFTAVIETPLQRDTWGGIKATF